MLPFVTLVKIFVLRTSSAFHVPLSTLKRRHEQNEKHVLADGEHKALMFTFNFIRTQRTLELCSNYPEKLKCSLRPTEIIQSEKTNYLQWPVIMAMHSGPQKSLLTCHEPPIQILNVKSSKRAPALDKMSSWKCSNCNTGPPLLGGLIFVLTPLNLGF